MQEISIKAQQLFQIGSFGVTNSLVLMMVVSLVLVAAALLFYRKVSLVPSVAQSAVEMGAEWFLGLMQQALGSGEEAEKYFPLIATIFVFIFTSNVLGILPGVGSVVVHSNGAEIPLFRSPAADLNFTLAFAVISVLLTNIFGALTVGFAKHLGKYLNFRHPVKFFVGILEIISEAAKIISLSFRLFGNVFAGEVLLSIIFFLAPYFIPLPFLFMELFVGLIQAFLFAMLTLISISLHTAVYEH